MYVWGLSRMHELLDVGLSLSGYSCGLLLVSCLVIQFHPTDPFQLSLHSSSMSPLFTVGLPYRQLVYSWSPLFYGLPDRRDTRDPRSN